MKRQIPLKKRLGQHHLMQGHLCTPLIDYLSHEGGSVIEIGPGGGVLTHELLRAGARVSAVELDPAWAFHTRRQERSRDLRLVIGDALDLDWAAVRPGTTVTGNLPYSVGTVIIERLLRDAVGVSRAAFLVQLEVAHRLVAHPGDAEYGALSILVRARARARLLGRIGRGSFRPPPKVDGGMVGLERRSPPLPEGEMVEFERWVKAVFGMRRKALRNSLGRLWGADDARRALSECGVDGLTRPEELPLETWVRLFSCRRPSGPVPSRGC